MKKNFTRASVLATMAALAVGSLQAKDLYLSPDGDDANDGLTAATPRKTLTNLTSIIESGDVVNISGILHMATEYDLAVANNTLSKGHCGHFYKEGNQNGFQLKIDDARWTNITFRGEDPEEDGFDGDESWRFFELGRETNFSIWVDPENTVENSWVRFENLGFRNGYAPSEGGTFYIHDHIVADFDNCIFENNGTPESVLERQMEGTSIDVYQPNDGVTAERGGAIHFQFGQLTITNSYFTGNLSRRGSAICQTGGTLVLKNNWFDGNGAEIYDYPVRRVEGGALYIWTLHTSTVTDIDHCVFTGNASWSKGGAIYFAINVDEKDRYIDANITNTYFANNDAYWEHGGAVFCDLDNGTLANYKAMNVKFGNCAFIGNSAGFYGPNLAWKSANKNSSLTMVNCTMTKGEANLNRGETNGGHGANINFDANADRPVNNLTVNLYNCIMEGNQCGNNEYSDISLLNDHCKSISNLNVEHCVIGQVRGDENGIIAAASTTNYLNYHGGTTIEEGQSCFHEYAEDLGRGALTFNGYSWGAAPIEPNSQAASMGDKKYYVIEPRSFANEADPELTINVRGMDISATDMNGKARGENAVVGANEVSAEDLMKIAEEEADITDYFEYSGIEGVLAENNGLQLTIANGVVSAEDATITVMAVGGNKVAQAKNSVDLNGLAGGVYIVVARNGAALATAKIAK